MYMHKRRRSHLFRNIILLMQKVMKMIIDMLSLKVGDSSHISQENDVLCSIINEEKKKESFTVVEIGGISSNHATYLRQHLSSWTRQLALVEFYVWPYFKCICSTYIPRHTVHGDELTVGHFPLQFQKVACTNLWFVRIFLDIGK